MKLPILFTYGRLLLFINLIFVSFILHRASEEGLKKLQSMDEAFTKLKQVTGVKNVEEMHEKFSNQKSNKLQLELEVSKWIFNDFGLVRCQSPCSVNWVNYVGFDAFFSIGFCLLWTQVKDAEHRLNAAKKAHTKVESVYQELKSSGSGLTELNRESINK